VVSTLDLALLALALGVVILAYALLVSVRARRAQPTAVAATPDGPPTAPSQAEMEERRHRRVLAVREEALGTEHPDVAVALTILAAHLHAGGRFAEEEPLLRRALAIQERTLDLRVPGAMP